MHPAARNTIGPSDDSVGARSGRQGNLTTNGSVNLSIAKADGCMMTWTNRCDAPQMLHGFWQPVEST